MEELLQSGEGEDYHRIDDNLIKSKNKIYVSNGEQLKRLIMK